MNQKWNPATLERKTKLFPVPVLEVFLVGSDHNYILIAAQQ